MQIRFTKRTIVRLREALKTVQRLSNFACVVFFGLTMGIFLIKNKNCRQ